MVISAAAVYLRISSDREGDHQGVGRQRDDCEALAARRGWAIAEVYEDNDLSAWSGVRRPEFERMLVDVRDGLRDAVVVYDQDRLTRQPRDFERFLDICDDAGVTKIETVSGEFDLSSSDGRCMARMFSAMNRKSSDDTARRIRRKHAELAMEGKVSGGGSRPYGYTADKLHVVAEEAAVIREAAARVLAGDSIRSVCADFNDRNIGTATGRSWKPSVMQKMLTSARISGQREHLGEIMGEAEWPAIITPQETAGLRSAHGAGRRRSARSPRRYLLAGLLRCDHCAATLVSRPRAGGDRQYVCAKGPGLSGCGKLSVLADPVEMLIADGVMLRLDTPAFARTIERGIAANDQAAALREQLAADERWLEELAVERSLGEMTKQEWQAMRQPIYERTETNRRKLSRITSTNVLDGYVGNGEQLRAKWDVMDLDRQHGIVAAVLDHAVVLPAVRGRNRFDENRIKPVWKR